MKPSNAYAPEPCLAVVDVTLEGYDALLSDEKIQARGWQHFHSGEQALRCGDFSAASLWLVNMDLPDMEGVAFLGAVRQRSRRPPVFLVAERQSAADEVKARVAGASAYLAKPANAHWLALCHDALSRSALRRGLQQAPG